MRLQVGSIAGWLGRFEPDNWVDIEPGGLIIKDGPGSRDYRLKFKSAGDEAPDSSLESVDNAIEFLAASGYKSGDIVDGLKDVRNALAKR